MTALTICNVPNDLRDALVDQARQHRQSLQAFLLTVLKRQADFECNRRLLDEVGEHLMKHGGAGSDAPDAADVLARARTERIGEDTYSSTKA